jgi:preprotein translocase subunit SecD
MTHQDFYLVAADRRERLSLEEARRIDCSEAADPGKIEGGRVSCMIEGRAVLRRYLDELARVDPELAPPEEREIRYERLAISRDGQTRWRSYLLERTAALSGSAISGAKVIIDRDVERPAVQLDFNQAGARQLAELTARIVGQKLALLFEGRVLIAPVVNEAIQIGRLQISLGADPVEQQRKQAEELARVIEAGSLRASLREVPPATGPRAP